MNKLEFINVVLCTLSILIIYKGSIVNSLIVFTSYFLFHYSYLYIPVIFDSYTLDEIYQMRIIGSGVISKVLQLLVIGALLVKIELMLKWKEPTLKFFIIINILMALGFIYQNFIVGTLGRLEVQYYLTLCLFIWIIFIPNRVNSEINLKLVNKELIKNLAILFLMLIIISALYEVWINKAWAQTQVSLNQSVFRSSSLFYNPNLFAYYCVLAYLAIIYFSENEKKLDVKINIITFALIFCIFISGARGIFTFMLISIAIIAVLNKKIKLLYFLPYGMYLISGLVSITVENNFQYNLDNRNDLFQNFYYLSNRFFNIPFDIFLYFLSSFNHLFDSLLVNSLEEMNTMDTNTQLSIEGRFCAGCDNGWIILYSDQGLFGVLAFLILYFNICFYIVKYKKISLDSKKILLSSILFILLAGSAMRFQILTIAIVTATYISLLLIIRNK